MTTRLHTCETAMVTARNLLQVARETFDLKPTHRAHEVEAACALAVAWAAHLATLSGGMPELEYEHYVTRANYYIEEAGRDLATLSEARAMGMVNW